MSDTRTDDERQFDAQVTGPFLSKADTPPSIRERLEAAAKPYLRTESDTNIWAAIDAILTELQEPSDGMVRACMREAESQGVATDPDSPPLYFGEVIRAAMQHIKDGGS